MTKLAELTEEIIRANSGGEYPNDGKIEPRWVEEALIPRLRQKAMHIRYNGDQTHAANKFIPQDWYSKPYKLTVDKSIQQAGADYVIFKLLPSLSLNWTTDGNIFVGSEIKTKNFTRITTPAYAASLKARGDLNENNIGYLIHSDIGKFYGDTSLKYVDFIQILENPVDHPTFDIDDDDYPICENVKQIMIELAKIELSGGQPDLAKPQDTILDGADTTERRILKSNIV